MRRILAIACTVHFHAVGGGWYGLVLSVEVLLLFLELPLPLLLPVTLMLQVLNLGIQIRDAFGVGGMNGHCSARNGGVARGRGD